MRLGEKIKELRLHNGRTQDAFAGELGVTAQAVSRWEKGICYPDMEMIVRMDEFLAFEEKMRVKYHLPLNSIFRVHMLITNHRAWRL